MVRWETGLGDLAVVFVSLVCTGALVLVFDDAIVVAQVWVVRHGVGSLWHGGVVGYACLGVRDRGRLASKTLVIGLCVKVKCVTGGK